MEGGRNSLHPFRPKMALSYGIGLSRDSLSLGVSALGFLANPRLLGELPSRGFGGRGSVSHLEQSRCIREVLLQRSAGVQRGLSDLRGEFWFNWCPTSHPTFWVGRVFLPKWTKEKKVATLILTSQIWRT